MEEREKRILTGLVFAAVILVVAWYASIFVGAVMILALMPVYLRRQIKSFKAEGRKKDAKALGKALKFHESKKAYKYAPIFVIATIILIMVLVCLSGSSFCLFS